MRNLPLFAAHAQHALALIALACLAAAPLSAQPPRPPTLMPQGSAQADEIVVTVQRSGIPVWRVTGPRTTLVLVGSVGRVAAGTRWNPVPLDAALAKADRVMFPESVGFGGGMLTIVSALGKWRKQARLPGGQTLQTIVAPAQWSRLTALRDKGVLKAGFERRHPYHLAMSLRRTVRDKGRTVPGADAYVRRFVGKNKAKRVPLAQGSAKALMAEYFALEPRAHVACLMNAVAMAEQGQAGIRARAGALEARSDAWASRRVPDALALGTDERQRPCWPAGGRFDKAREAALQPVLRGLLSKPEVTLAVVSLGSLAERGGVLDDLVAAGFDVQGPRWKP